MKILEISKNTSGKVRDKLCMHDVYIPEWEVLAGFGLVGISTATYVDENMQTIKEDFLWFKESVRIPKFNKFYASRISSIKDPYFTELVKRLLYLNPNPDKLLIKKLTEHVILRFSRMEMKDSEVKIGETIAMPVLKFEDVEPAISLLSMMEYDYEPDNEIPVLFNRESKIPREVKISIIAKHRGAQVKDKLEGAIHIAAEHLIDKREYLKVTNSRIKDTGLVETSRGVASINTITKYIGGRTRKIIDEHNDIAPFKTEATEKAYEEFLTISDKSVAYIANELEISNSTVLMFRKLKEKGLLIQKDPVGSN